MYARFGLNFRNPIGVAAGFDKNGEVPDALLRLGFGFVEAGSVTPRPQERQSAPAYLPPRRRRRRDQPARLQQRGRRGRAEAACRRAAEGGIIGINIGANRDSPDRAADYVRLVEAFAPVVSYITVNVSSPNTPGLRDLQVAKSLDDLLARVIEVRDRVRAHAGPDAASSEDRARPYAGRSRRSGRRRARSPQGRRHDRRQHHASAVRRRCWSEKSR